MTTKQSIFVECILTGKTINESAATAGVSKATGHNWLKKGLRDTINELRKQAFEISMQKLEASMSSAVNTLGDLMGEAAPPPQRLGAAKTVLEQAVRLYELRDIDRRLAALEAAQKKTPAGV
jgi:hypothetical protein